MIRHNLGRFIVSKLSHQLQVSNARARSCYVSLIHHYPIVSIVTFRVDSRHINAGLRVTEVLLRGASTGMYSSIELTHGQFVQDMSAPVEKDTLINCCHVRQPASSFLSFLIFSFPPSFLFLFFFFSLLNLRPASRKNFQSSIPSTFLPNSRLYNKGLQRRNRITRIIVSLKARQLDRTRGRMYAYVAKRFKNSIRFSIL